MNTVFVTAVFTLSVGNGKPAAITLLLHYAPTATGNKALRDGELGQEVDGRTDLMLFVLNFQVSNQPVGKILCLFFFFSSIHLMETPQMNVTKLALNLAL